MKRYIITIAASLILFLPADGDCAPKKHRLLSTKYIKPPHLDQEIWDSVSPYLLPEDHPMKGRLDAIFNNGTRVALSSKTLKAAGFEDPKPGKYSGTIVTTHKKLKGHIVKLYTDDQADKIDWAYLKDRVTGAQSVQRSITTHQYEKLIKTPKKWLYPLPPTPAPPAGMVQKNFILIEEDMVLVGKKHSLAIWRTNQVSGALLNAIYVILKENGLADCTYAFNMPFAEDSRIAFIDTELHHQTSVHYSRLLPYLSPANQVYWRRLMEKGGP